MPKYLSTYAIASRDREFGSRTCPVLVHMALPTKSHVGGTTGLHSAIRGLVSHSLLRGGFDVTAS